MSSFPLIDFCGTGKLSASWRQRSPIWNHWIKHRFQNPIYYNETSNHPCISRASAITSAAFQEARVRGAINSSSGAAKFATWTRASESTRRATLNYESFKRATRHYMRSLVWITVQWKLNEKNWKYIQNRVSLGFCISVNKTFRSNRQLFVGLRTRDDVAVAASYSVQDQSAFAPLAQNP